MMKIGDAAVKWLKENPDHGNCIWWGDPCACHAIADMAGLYDRCKSKRGVHPLNIINKVLNGLEKDKRFEKHFIRHIRLTRAFWLKEEGEHGKQN